MSETDPLKGQFKPKELGTGNLDVIPITIAVQEFIKQHNLAHHSDKTQKDFAFGYDRKRGMQNGGYYSKNEIHSGNLVFDHIQTANIYHPFAYITPAFCFRKNNYGYYLFI